MTTTFENSKGYKVAVKEAEKTSQGVEVQKNPSMMTMLIPWITFWIAVSVNTEKGSVIALLVHDQKTKKLVQDHL